MTVSSITASFSADIQKVWEIVTSLTDYSWRHDLQKIDQISDSEFIETSKDGIQTRFEITCFLPLERYEFSMENDKMRGTWIGLFSQENGQTCIKFTENIMAKKLLLKPFVKIYLKKQQEQYIKDLQEKLRK